MTTPRPRPWSGRCSPLTATTWPRTPSACSSRRRRICWQRCRTPWSNSRSIARSPSRWPVRIADGRAGTRTRARSWCAACSARCSWRVPAALRLPQPAHPHLPAAGRAAARADHPELAYLQARFTALVSYGITADLLGELLPLGRRLHPAVVRRQTQAVAQRLEDELGWERPSFIDTCQRDREELPRPDLPIVVGLDGGYVHSSQQRSRTDGWFEVIAGKAIPADGRPACFGYVQTYDTKPKRRLFEVLKAQGMAANQQVTFLTDGGEDIRDLPCCLNAQAEHLWTGST
jgi:hypothetical protein